VWNCQEFFVADRRNMGQFLKKGKKGLSTRG
jgi:hypothetical protein